MACGIVVCRRARVVRVGVETRQCEGPGALIKRKRTAVAPQLAGANVHKGRLV